VPEFAQPLREDEVDPSPFVQFRRWFQTATDAGIRAPEAAALATATTDGAPSARIVLVKTREESGFVFYTSYASRKGRELSSNPRGALLFHWDPVGQEVRIEGSVERVRGTESAAYIRSRPRASQLSALASPQSEVIESREWLEQRVSDLASIHAHRDLPVPEQWGGFRLLPDIFEFWQHREDRLHDRLRYSRQPDGRWKLERLAP
jgi:pyridoxamine 5'-phosphate oxidase